MFKEIVIALAVVAIPTFYCFFQMDLAAMLFQRLCSFNVIFKFASSSIFLTIDDVASDIFEQILWKLEKYCVKATFFVIGGTITKEKEEIFLIEDVFF